MRAYPVLLLSLSVYISFSVVFSVKFCHQHFKNVIRWFFPFICYYQENKTFCDSGYNSNHNLNNTFNYKAKAYLRDKKWHFHKKIDQKFGVFNEISRNICENSRNLVKFHEIFVKFSWKFVKFQEIFVKIHEIFVKLMILSWKFTKFLLNFMYFCEISWILWNWEERFDRIGISNMPLNSVFQLCQLLFLKIVQLQLKLVPNFLVKFYQKWKKFVATIPSFQLQCLVVSATEISWKCLLGFYLDFMYHHSCFIWSTAFYQVSFWKYLICNKKMMIHVAQI